MWNEFNGSWCQGPARDDKPYYYTEILKKTYDLYIDNNFIYSFAKLAAVNQEELFKIGADANRLADFEIDYIRMGRGEILPSVEPAEI